MAALVKIGPDQLRKQIPDPAADDGLARHSGLLAHPVVRIDVAPLAIERRKCVADAAQDHLALFEKIAHFVLPTAGAQSDLHRANQGQNLERPPILV